MAEIEAPASTALLEELRTIAGPDGVLEGDAVSARSTNFWDSSPLKAMAIVRPRSAAEVSAILAVCNRAGQPVVTHGGLTGLVDAAGTGAGDLVLSVERMADIEEIDTDNRTMTVQAGCKLQTVQEAADANGLQFTLDLGARGSCTIGGNVATNAGGTQVIRYGMAREQVLGLEVVLADGTVLSSMNRMLKNNAGYDLKQLFVGSEGTLGVITRLVLRLRERPRSTCTALAACESLDAVIALLKHMDAGLGGTLSSYEVLWRDYYRLVSDPESGHARPLAVDYPYYALVESQGSDQDSDQARFESVLGEAMEAGLVVDAVIANSGKEREALWGLREDVEQAGRYGPVITFDVSLGIPDMARYVEAVGERLTKDWGDAHHCWVFGHLGDGNLHLVVAVGDDQGEARRRVEQAVYAPLEAIGGSVSAEHGIGLEKKPWLKLSRTPEEIEVMRRLKRALDPNGILNPGKVFDLEPPGA